MIHSNPDGTLSIKLNYVTTRTSVEIYNKTGERVFKSSISSIEQDVDHRLPRGSYTLKIMEDNWAVGCHELVVE